MLRIRTKNILPLIWLLSLLTLLSGRSAFAQTPSTGWLADDALVTVERGAKASWKLAATTTGADAANLFVIAKSMGGSARIDLTPILALQDGALQLDLALINVPAGKYEIEVSHIGAGGKIQILARTSMAVTAPAGAATVSEQGGAIEPATQRSSFKPKLDVGVRSQLYERRNADAGVSARKIYNDMTLEGGFETLNSGEDWELKSTFSFAGNSNRNEAPQFGNKGAEASKVDLTNYLIEGGKGDARFAAGNINVSANPLLVQGIGNRGISASGKLPVGVDINASLQSGGGAQAGFDNMLGISQSNNMFRQAGAGFDVDPDHPGKARFDFTRLSATQKIGTLATGGDAIEKSEGYGLRFSGRNSDGRGRLEMAIAASTQTPAGNPPAVINRGYAWTTEAGYDVLKDWAWRPEIPVSFNAGVRLEHSSPVYRSLGSSFGANYHQMAGLFNLKIGPSLVQSQIVRRYDNVGEDRQYIRNRVSSWAVNGSFPLDQLVKAWEGKPAAPAASAAPSTPPPTAEATAAAPTAAATPAAPSGEAAPATQAPPAAPIAAAEPTSAAATADAAPAAAAKPADDPSKPNPFWPAFTYSRKSVLGYGDAGFIPTGYTIDDLPKLQVWEQSWGLRWAFERVQLGLKRITVIQDNQQVGFTNADVTDMKWGYSMDLKVTEALTVGASYDLGTNLNYGTSVAADQFQAKIGATYNFNADNALVSEFNRGLSRDSGTTYALQRSFQIQWTSKFKTPALGSVAAMPAQFYLRLMGATGYTAQTSGIPLTPITYAVQFGVTLSVF